MRMNIVKLSVFIRNEQQYKIVKNFDIETIYTDNLELIKKDQNLYYAPSKKENITLQKKLLIKDVGFLEKYKDTHEIILDYGLNIANQSTIELFEKWNVQKMTLSLELTLEELNYFQDLKSHPVEILIYGRVIDMTLKKHPLINENGLILEDLKKRKYPVKVKEDKTVYIYHHEPINKIKDIKKYIDLGIRNFRIDFYEEEEKEIKEILKNVINIKNSHK